jgi:hypothetical protein
VRVRRSPRTGMIPEGPPPHSEKTGEMVKTCGAFHNEQTRHKFH